MLRKVRVPVWVTVVVDDDDFDSDQSDDELAYKVAGAMFDGVVPAIRSTAEFFGWWLDDYHLTKRPDFSWMRVTDQQWGERLDPEGEWNAPFPTAHLCRPDGGEREQYEILDALWKRYVEDGKTNDDLKAMIQVMQSNIMDQGSEMMGKIMDVINHGYVHTDEGDTQ